MIQVRDFHALNLEEHEQTSVTIGNFDGCHLGHQQLTAATTTWAAQMGATPVAVTFDPRPEAFFRKLPAEPLLFTEAQKTRGLAELGIKYQILQPFNAAFSQLTHTEFYLSYLRKKLRAVAVVVGDDFRFGHQRLGDTAYLRDRARTDGINLTIGTAVNYAGQRISSTRLRETIANEGDVTAAALMLGRPYLIEGVIAKGDQLGRQIGVPTANLAQVSQLLPRFGVYAGYVWLTPELGSRELPPVTNRPGAAIPAVFNLGVRPTVGQPNPPVRIEAHLLSGSFGPNALYGLHAGYYFAHRLRNEVKFGDLNQLKAQISLDIKQAHALLGI